MSRPAYRVQVHFPDHDIPPTIPSQLATTTRHLRAAWSTNAELRGTIERLRAHNWAAWGAVLALILGTAIADGAGALVWGSALGLYGALVGWILAQK